MITKYLKNYNKQIVLLFIITFYILNSLISFFSFEYQWFKPSLQQIFSYDIMLIALCTMYGLLYKGLYKQYKFNIIVSLLSFIFVNLFYYLILSVIMQTMNISDWYIFNIFDINISFIIYLTEILSVIGSILFGLFYPEYKKIKNVE